MSSDARLAVSFRTHPKRIKLQKRIGAAGVLAFIDLVLFTAESKPDGILSGMSVEDICIAAQWQEDASKFVLSLVEVGLLDKVESEDSTDSRFKLHDWNKWNSYAANAPSRSKASARAAHLRWLKERGITCNKKTCEHCGPHAAGMRKLQKRNAPVPAPSPAPAPAHTHTARECVSVFAAAREWNRMAPEIRRPLVTDVSIDHLADEFEAADSEIRKSAPEFTWAGCLDRIDPHSWLATECGTFGFEWLPKRSGVTGNINALDLWLGKYQKPQPAPRSKQRMSF